MSIVYFLASMAVDPASGDPVEVVKIGRTSGRPSARVSQLATGVPNKIEYMGYIPGGAHVERALHDECVKQHFRGEWFFAEGVAFHRLLEACENQFRAPL